MQTVREGVITPSVVAIAPGRPATWMPTKVAQLMPREPGVISAIATMSESCSIVIQW